MVTQRLGESRDAYLDRARTYASVRYAGSGRTRVIELQRAARKANPGHAAALHKARRRKAIERIWGRPIPSLCEICGGDNNGKTLHADHDHATGQPRLFLCLRCNVIEGMLLSEWPRVSGLLAYNAWFNSARATADYPIPPTPSPNDLAWVRTYMDRK